MKYDRLLNNAFIVQRIEQRSSEPWMRVRLLLKAHKNKITPIMELFYITKKQKAPVWALLFVRRQGVEPWTLSLRGTCSTS